VSYRQTVSYHLGNSPERANLVWKDQYWKVGFWNLIAPFRVPTALSCWITTNRKLLAGPARFTEASCHGRGRGFESRRPGHSFQRTYIGFGETIQDPKRHVSVHFFVPFPFVLFAVSVVLTLQRHLIQTMVALHALPTKTSTTKRLPELRVRLC
jgi:hypothetical protein